MNAFVPLRRNKLNRAIPINKPDIKNEPYVVGCRHVANFE
jgi:hypothetical protein